MLDIDWRSPPVYAPDYTIPLAGLAWEYLRRDEHYHHAFSKIDHKIDRQKAFDPGVLEAFSKRWGLRFPP